MANELITSSIIVEETLMELTNQLVFTKLVSKPGIQFGESGRKAGDTISLRLPVQFGGRRGEKFNAEAIQERSFPFTLAPLYGVDFTVSDVDLTLSVDRFKERYLKPAATKIANDIDVDGLALAREVFSFNGGAPGTDPTALSSYLAAKVRLDNQGAPDDDDRHIVLTTGMESAIVNALIALFHSSRQIEGQYEKGSMGRAAGFQWHMSQNVLVHTVGQLGGTPLVNGLLQSGSSIITNGWTGAVANRLKRGDIVSFATVNAVNPITKQDTGQLAQFTVTADAASDGSGNLTIPISPAIVLSGPYQNVTAAPTTSDAVTIFGHASSYASKVTAQGLAFHPQAFAWVSVPLEQPKDVEGAVVNDEQLGISIRYLRRYDIDDNLYKCRLDVLGGWACPRPEFACRIVGA